MPISNSNSSIFLVLSLLLHLKAFSKHSKYYSFLNDKLCFKVKHNIVNLRKGGWENDGFGNRFQKRFALSTSALVETYSHCCVLLCVTFLILLFFFSFSSVAQEGFSCALQCRANIKRSGDWNQKYLQLEVQGPSGPQLLVWGPSGLLLLLLLLLLLVVVKFKTY